MSPIQRPKFSHPLAARSAAAFDSHCSGGAASSPVFMSIVGPGFGYTKWLHALIGSKSWTG